MTRIAILTALFGMIEFDSSEGMWKSDARFTVGDATVTTRISFLGHEVTEANAPILRTYLDTIPDMYRKCWDRIAATYTTDPVIVDFINDQRAEIYPDDLVDYFAVSCVDEITPEKFLEKIRLRAIWFSLPEDVNTSSDTPSLNCCFDFGLDSDFSDEILACRFTENRELTGISHES